VIQKKASVENKSTATSSAICYGAADAEFSKAATQTPLPGEEADQEILLQSSTKLVRECHFDYLLLMSKESEK
jgi:hypothetical protein